MNTVRVFLHFIPWAEDRSGFLRRLNDFLTVAAGNGLKVAFVLLDDTWHPFPKYGRPAPLRDNCGWTDGAGEQPEPIPLIHNSQWVQNPGWAGLLNDTFQDGLLQSYVREVTPLSPSVGSEDERVEVVDRFKDDTRVLFWDVYNEPGRGFYHDLHNKTAYSARLLSKVFDWVRLIGPAQPLTSAVFRPILNKSLDDIQTIQISLSDFISFHNYRGPDEFKRCHSELMEFGRPVMCTEYLARDYNSTFQVGQTSFFPSLSAATFESILPMAKERWVGALNWGWVAGKTQALVPWDSWYTGYRSLPRVWFQDVLYPNGTAYDVRELESARLLLATTALHVTRVSPRLARFNLSLLPEPSSPLAPIVL